MTLPGTVAAGDTTHITDHNTIDTFLRSLPKNVVDYGAVANDSTDCSTAFTAAIAALSDGSCLYFPPGVYLTSTRTVVTALSKVDIIGHGATIHCTASGTSNRVLLVNACSDVGVYGLTLKHSSGTRTTNADALGINNCTDVTVQGVKVPYALSMGIKVAGSRRVTVDGCSVTGSLADGIGVYQSQRNGTADASITSGHATLTSSSALFTSLDVGANVRVTGAGSAAADLLTTISSVASGVATLATNASTTVTTGTVYIARPSAHVTISGNHVDSSGDDCISVVGYQSLTSITLGHNTDISITGNTTKYGSSRGIMVAGGKRVTVGNNIVDSARNAGILVWHDPGSSTLGVQDVVVSDNVVDNANIENSPSGAYPSIGVQSVNTTYPAENVAIVNNKIRGGAQNYISAGSTGSPSQNGVTNVRIEGNDCRGANGAGSGIKVHRTTNARVVNNVVNLARTYGIYIETDVTGLVEVSNNLIDQPNQSSAASTYGIFCPTASAKISGNKIYDTGGFITIAILATAATAATLYGNDVGSLTISAPSSQGYFLAGVYSASTSYISDSATGGFVFKSANGHYWRATVDNSGTISTSDLGTTKPTS